MGKNPRIWMGFEPGTSRFVGECIITKRGTLKRESLYRRYHRTALAYRRNITGSVFYNVLKVLGKSEKFDWNVFFIWYRIENLRIGEVCLENVFWHIEKSWNENRDAANCEMFFRPVLCQYGHVEHISVMEHDVFPLVWIKLAPSQYTEVSVLWYD